MPRMITIGTLVEAKGEDGDMTASGQRTMAAALLEKVALFVADHPQAHMAVQAWLDGTTKPPGKTACKTAAEAMDAKERAAADAGDWRESVYFETAAFCCRAWAEK